MCGRKGADLFGGGNGRFPGKKNSLPSGEVFLHHYQGVSSGLSFSRERGGFQRLFPIRFNFLFFSLEGGGPLPFLRGGGALLSPKRKARFSVKRPFLNPKGGGEEKSPLLLKKRRKRLLSQRENFLTKGEPCSLSSLLEKGSLFLP